MTDHIPKIHDRFAKRSLQEIPIARDFLKTHLPKEILEQIDLDSIRPIKTDFVPDNLKEYLSDVAYECRIRGKLGYILALIEHQSTPKFLMPFRTLQYCVNLMDAHIRKGHKKLPVVVTLCLYNGTQSPYPEETDIFECFDDPGLARKTLLSNLQVIDLSVMSREEIESHGLAALMEGLLQQHARNRLQDIAECIHWLLESNILARTVEGTAGNYLEGVIKYIAQTGDAGSEAETRKLLSDIAANLPEDKGEQVMTIAETLRNAGMQQGMQAGMEQGMQAGMQQGEQHRSYVIAESMLRDGLPEPTISKYTGLELSEVVALRKKMSH